MTPAARQYAAHLERHRRLFAELEALAEPVLHAAALMSEALRAGGRLFACGNGGSAAAAQQFAAACSGRLAAARGPLAAIALPADVASLTAIADDAGYEQVVARPLAALARPGDVLVVLWAQGPGHPLRLALETARECGVATVALVGDAGGEGGRALALADAAVVLPPADPAVVHEAQLFVVHAWCEGIERALGRVA